ncbi:MAG TPA: RagB/SusD family nutrient uptake outer membrane protein [Puia sp.]|nr:RagB/SusD family nutrient uptake outer membrane protein [Puia sp.]
MRYSNYLYIFILLWMPVYACKKASFLHAKPDNSLLIPSSPQDCQRLLDDDRVMNGFGNAGYPCMPEIGSDDYYIDSTQFDMYSSASQQAAIWARDIPTGDESPDWDLPYRVVLTANGVLEALTVMTAGNQLSTLNSIKGAAFFFRAYAFYSLAEVFCQAYDSSTSVTDEGLPLRLSTDVNERLSRATVQQTYDQILSDLRAARSLLSKDSNWLPTRPSLAAVYGLFARIFLSARNYSQALRYADSCLQLRPALMRYDTLSKTSLFPFNRWNPEVIFSAAYFSSGPAATYRSHTDSLLFRSYQPNDLRKDLFFKYGDYFFGRYDQDGYCFSGIATDEIYLIRSECLARAGNINAAMTDLNHLLETRWAAGTFTPYIAIDADDALQQILQERRKELIYRGLRWSDLRRLNKNDRTAHTLTRMVEGILYTLPPNDPRWVLPIPGYVLSFNPGMPQNTR